MRFLHKSVDFYSRYYDRVSRSLIFIAYKLFLTKQCMYSYHYVKALKRITIIIGFIILVHFRNFEVCFLASTKFAVNLLSAPGLCDSSTESECRYFILFVYAYIKTKAYNFSQSSSTRSSNMSTIVKNNYV